MAAVQRRPSVAGGPVGCDVAAQIRQTDAYSVLSLNRRQFFDRRFYFAPQFGSGVTSFALEDADTPLNDL